jgi:hypothetical protein
MKGDLFGWQTIYDLRGYIIEIKRRWNTK